MRGGEGSSVPGGGRPIPLAAILMGGRSLRMGADKAGLSLGGMTLAEWVLDRVAAVAQRVVAIGGGPWLARRGVVTLPDLFPGAGSLGGIATALGHAEATLGPDDTVLCVGCDMPFLEPVLLRGLHDLSGEWDVVVPRLAAGYEPLCALYRARCCAVFRGQIERGDLRTRAAFERVRTREVSESELRALDPDLQSFLNVNRPEDLEAARRRLP